MATDVNHSSTVDQRTTATVREVTYDLLRAYGLTTIFGNLGSTEEPFLADYPSDFRYVLGLQEASVIAMADGFAQATRGPALVNLHTGAGLGNAMGNLGTAFQNKTPLIVTAGQQTREMLLLEPYLTNAEPTMLPRPWVKWAYQPARAQDVPAAFMRAIATALQPPRDRSSCRCRSTIGRSRPKGPPSCGPSAPGSRRTPRAWTSSPTHCGTRPPPC
jgi:benzoylformate decarboxylase